MRSGDPSEIRRSLFWSKPGANPGPKPCQVRGLPGWDVLVQGDPGGVTVPGGRGRDSLWAVPSSAARLLLGAFQREEFLTAVTLPSWAAALEPGVGVCLLFHCALARLVSSSPPRSVALGSLCNPFGCSSARIQPGFRQNASPVWLGVFGWDDGMEVGSHQKEHPSDGPEEWEGQVRWRWLRMEPSHRHGGVSSGGPPQDLLGPFFYHLMVLEESWFLREAHPRWHVLAGGTRWRRRSKDPVLCRSGSKGLAPTAVMSVPVSAPAGRAVPPGQASLSPRAREGDGAPWSSVCSRTWSSPNL